MYKRESNKKSISEEENNEISVLVKTIFGLSIIGLIPVFLDLINKLISSNILNEIGKYKFFKLFQNKIAVSLFSLLFLGSATSMILTKYSSKKNQMPNTD